MIKLSFEFDYSSYIRNIKESDLILDEIEDTWIYRFYNSMYDFEVSGDVEDGTITDNNLKVLVSLNGDKIGKGHFVSIEFLIIKQYKIYGSINSSISQQIS